MDAEVAEIFRRTREALANVMLAAQDVKSQDPARRWAAARNVPVWGRAVTGTLQRLRSRVDGFDDWYGPKREEMRSDPLLRYMWELRNRLLKAGESLPAGVSRMSIATVSTADVPPRDQWPPGAESFFVGDSTGGSGFRIDLGDGAFEHLYVTMPEGMVTSTLSFVDAPTEHLGEPVKSDSLEILVDLYASYLAGLVNEARARFASGP